MMTRHLLKPKAPYDDIEVPVELAVLYEVADGSVETIDEDSEDLAVNAEEELKKSQAEARYIISSIQELMNKGTTVYDPWKKTERRPYAL